MAPGVIQSIAPTIPKAKMFLHEFHTSWASPALCTTPVWRSTRAEASLGDTTRNQALSRRGETKTLETQ